MTDKRVHCLMIILKRIHFTLLPPSDAEAAENVSMTLTELSVFMKKQELELQLRTEKEKEEGEVNWRVDTYFSSENFG